MVKDSQAPDKKTKDGSTAEDLCSQQTTQNCTDDACSCKMEAEDQGSFYQGTMINGHVIIAAANANPVYTHSTAYPPDTFQLSVGELALTGSYRGSDSLQSSMDLRVVSKLESKSREDPEPGELVDGTGKAIHDQDRPYESSAFTAVNLEHLTPALIHDKTHQYIAEHFHSISHHRPYPYHGEISRWEQEGQRYADLPWKAAQDYHDNNAFSHGMHNPNSGNNGNNNHAEVCDNAYIGSDSHRSELYNSDGCGGGVGDVGDGGSDVYTPSYLSDSSSGTAPAGQGRRRRKRIQTPTQRTAANLRERRRMCHLNVAFDKLKEHLPNVKDKKKLSRIQTLKAAIYYIHLLRDSLKS